MTLYSAATIRDKLASAFAPQALDVIDESHLHAGHHHPGSAHQEAFAGAGGTHFRVRIAAGAFAGMSRLAGHRAISALLRPELEAGVHALAIEASAPGEPAPR